MKKIFSGFHNFLNKKKNSSFLSVWLIVHLGLPVLLGISLFFAPPLRISTQIMDLLPQTDTAKIAEADNILTERNNREAVILFASDDFEKAKNAGLAFYNEFKDFNEIENSTLLFDSDAIEEIANFYFKHRFVIAQTNTVDLLESGRADEIAMDALIMAYGAFNYIPLANIDKDPFLLTEREIRSFLSSSMNMASGGNLNIKDDVLTVQKDGVWYVMFRMTLSPEAVSVTNIKNNIIGKFHFAAEKIKEAEPDIKFYFSGAPFHSFESASNAQREISVIGTVSITFVLLLLLFIFRSPVPVIFSIMDILISLVLGTTATFLFFREIHAFTFIFGTVLIGICIDYSIHFFIHWRGNAELKKGYEIRSHISKSMIMCFVSTIICYSAVIFAPLPIFRQFGVFAIAGLCSSFLTAYCIYPLLKLPKENKRFIKLPKLALSAKFKIITRPVFRAVSVLVISGTFITILCINPQGVKLNNDLSALYAMPPHLMESEMQVAMVMDQTSAPLYYIISGSSAEETLKNEERLTARLEEEIKKGNLSSFMGTSINIPSIEKQERTYKAMSALMPYAAMQYENLGFSSEYEKAFFYEYETGNNYCHPENAPSWTGASNLWIGNVIDNYFSCVMLFHVKDNDLFLSLADEFDFVHFINIEEIITRDLNTLTRTIVLFFFAAFLIVAVIIFIVYSVKDSIKICMVPVLVVLAIMAVLAVLKIPLGFLPISAIILVFGLGIDFMLYITGSKNEKTENLTRFAVFLSFLTTILSFGLLSLSSFTPIYIFGLTVAVGLAAAFVFTMLLQGKKEQV